MSRLPIDAPMGDKTFLSYARTDAEFALRLATDLRAARIDIWIDQLDIRTGDMWDQEVETALRECSNFLVVLSPSSVASRAVMDEVAFALEENKRVLPVVYRECTIPFRLRRVQFTDFSSKYDAALAQLIDEIIGPRSRSEPLDELKPSQAQLSAWSSKVPAFTRTRMQATSWLSRHSRIRSAIYAGLLGSVISTVLLLPWILHRDLVLRAVIFPIPFYAIAGAISGASRLPRVCLVLSAATAATIAAAWFIDTVSLFEDAVTSSNVGLVAALAVSSASLGAVFGAIVGRVILYLRRGGSLRPDVST